MVKLAISLVLFLMLSASAVAADNCAQQVNGDICRCATAVRNGCDSNPVANLAVGRSCQSNRTGIHGAVRYRAQWEKDFARANDLSSRLDFDLNFVGRLTDDMSLKLELGTGRDFSDSDVIGRRSGWGDDLRLKRAFLEAHVGGDAE